MSKRNDDPENPELGDDFFARAQRGLDHVPRPMRNGLLDEQARVAAAHGSERRRRNWCPCDSIRMSGSPTAGPGVGGKVGSMRS